MNIDDLNVNSLFRPISEAIEDAIVARKNLRKNVIPFGIDYLDDSSVGIFQNDLILLGAQSGIGKTQFATILAKHAALIGKRVVMFALEAEKFEIERRLLFQFMPEKEFTFDEYMSGLANDHVDEVERIAAKKLSSLSNLRIFYKTKRFGPEELTTMMLSINSQTDLYLIDHIHFLDYEPEKNETVAHKEAISIVRDTALSLGKPVVVLAQMNKAYAKDKTPVPGMYDFYGTSSLINVATKIITISQKKISELGTKDVSQTLFFVAKNRMAGSVTRFVGLTGFDFRKGEYLPKYFVFNYPVDSGDEPINQRYDLPKWAVNAKLPGPKED